MLTVLFLIIAAALSALVILSKPARQRFSAFLATAFHAPVGFAGRAPYSLANIGEGTHDGNITKKADVAFSSRFLLAKFGSDVDHVAIAGVADIAIGVATDEALVAEDLMNIALLGSSDNTLKMQASAAIAIGDFVVSAANGQIRTLPGTTGTYYIIGRALQAAASAGDLLEVDPCIPTQRVVP